MPPFASAVTLDTSARLALVEAEVPRKSGAPVPTVASTFEHAFELGALWQDLLRQEVRNVSFFFTAEECGVIVERTRKSRFATRLSEWELRVLERVVFGLDQKVVAMDAGRSPGHVSGTLRKTLTMLGFPCTASKVPAIVVLAAHAARLGPGAVPARASAVEVNGRACLRILSPRPDRCFPVRLTDTEAAVVRLFVEGLSHAQIARVRGRSQRTIANQLAAVFHKMGISGRTRLLCRLVECAAQTG